MRRKIYILVGRVQALPTDPLKEGAGRPQFRADGKTWCRMSIGPTPLTFNDWASRWCIYKRRRFRNSGLIIHHDGSDEEDFDCICELLPYGLLLVPKITHEEVSSVLYPENMFNVCPTNRKSGPNGLSFLLLSRF